MKRFFAFFHRRRWQQPLMLYGDGELPQNEMAQMRRHLERCSACRQALADIRASRELLKVGRTPQPFVPTEQLWLRIVKETSASSPKWFKFEEIFLSISWRYVRWPVAVAGLVLFGLIVREKMNEDERDVAAEAGQSFAFAGIDYGIFLDDMRREVSAANFYKRYPAQVVQLVEAQQKIAFPLAAIEALPDSFRLDCVRVLECNGRKCVQFTCIKAGKVINIFQHALGQAWTLGQFAVVRAPICNVECLLVSTKNTTAVSWKGNHSEYLAIGDLAQHELAQVVQVLQ
jgi:hypothetical protein